LKEHARKTLIPLAEPIGRFLYNQKLTRLARRDRFHHVIFLVTKLFVDSEYRIFFIGGRIFMDINDIRTSISNKLYSVETHELWDDILQETSPANYGFEVDVVSVDKQDVWVDVPNRTFTFKNLDLSFSVRLGASNDRDGYDEDFQFKLSGSGTFSFDKAG